jgi:DNA-directed RNA polymerase subunit RPC12/RpoP
LIRRLGAEKSVKGTLKDQLTAAVISGKLEISEIEGKAARVQPKRRSRPKLKWDSQDRDILFFKRLAMESLKQSLVNIELPRELGYVRNFLDALYDVNKTNAISHLEHFFCLAAFARLKPSDCAKEWYFRQRLTVAAKNILIKKRSNQSLSRKDAEDFERIFKRVRSFINDDELDGLLNFYEKRKAQEEYARNQIEIDRKRSEIERRLSVYDFERAERLYQKYKDIVAYAIYQELVMKYETKQAEEKLCHVKRLFERFDFDGADKAYLDFARIIPREKYDEMKLFYQEKYSLKMLDEIVMPHLRSFNFSTAEVFYAEHRDIIWPKHYEKEKTEALVKQLERKIVQFLQEGDYAAADDLAETHPEFPKEQYLALKMGFVSRRLSSMGKSLFTPVEVQEFSKMILRENPDLANSLNSQKVGRFILDKLPETVSPPGLYIFVIEQLLDDIKKGILSVENEKVFLAARCVMESDQLSDNDKRSLWLVFRSCPSALQEFVNKAAPLLDKIADAYPYERLKDISEIYLPSEKACLRYLMKNESEKLDEELIGSLRALFSKRRFVNCQMVVALLKAKQEHHRLRLRDILDDLLKRIVTTAFDYNLLLKTPVQNLIFPRCLSDFENKNFQISDRDLIFCEGKRLRRRENGEAYILCRNRQCNERTELLESDSEAQCDNYFFDFLREEFGIDHDDISLNDDFIHAMGAFNRWNEIAERLVCGYGGTLGCGSTLIFSKAPQVKPGRAAYATTYWRCSNQSCHEAENVIKLSHCAGCGKIIDSRFDRVACNRKDGKSFYICMDCGYCCDEHRVSGICPKCGKNEGWDNLDQYGKRYQCKGCGHEILVPGFYKHCLDCGTGQYSHENAGFWPPTERKISVPQHDDIPFDDIPF